MLAGSYLTIVLNSLLIVAGCIYLGVFILFYAKFWLRIDAMLNVSTKLQCVKENMMRAYSKIQFDKNFIIFRVFEKVN